MSLKKNKTLSSVNERKNKQINYISVLSVIAAISVVFLHTNGAFWQFSTERYWFTANIIECVFYFAVPVFFMISGATLIDYRERYDTKTFFKKRISKTFIPFICWSIIALIYQIYGHKSIDINTLNFKMVYNGIVSASYCGIYWFFPTLFCVYLCIPVFSAIEKSKRKEVFTYLFVCSFIFNNLLPFINSVFNLGFNLPIYITVGSGYLLYIILGYLLHNNEVSKKIEYTIYILGILGLLLHIIGTYKLSMEASLIVKTFKEYNNVPCILYSMAIFLFIKKYSIKIKNKLFYKTINFLKDYTFPLYLVHMYVLEIITLKFNLNNLSILYRLGMPFIVIPISIAIVYIIRKIPIIKKIVP